MLTGLPPLWVLVYREVQRLETLETLYMVCTSTHSHSCPLGLELNLKVSFSSNYSPVHRRPVVRAMRVDPCGESAGGGRAFARGTCQQQCSSACWVGRGVGGLPLLRVFLFTCGTPASLEGPSCTLLLFLPLRRTRILLHFK